MFEKPHNPMLHNVNITDTNYINARYGGNNI